MEEDIVNGVALAAFAHRLLVRVINPFPFTGTVAVICAPELIMKLLAGTLLKNTPVTSSKSFPKILTTDPGGPVDGENELIDGG